MYEIMTMIPMETAYNQKAIATGVCHRGFPPPPPVNRIIYYHSGVAEVKMRYLVNNQKSDMGQLHKGRRVNLNENWIFCGIYFFEISEISSGSTAV